MTSVKYPIHGPVKNRNACTFALCNFILVLLLLRTLSDRTFARVGVRWQGGSVFIPHFVRLFPNFYIQKVWVGANINIKISL
jgi:hypothetical protein